VKDEAMAMTAAYLRPIQTLPTWGGVLA
jgi:hypothetical protein